MTFHDERVADARRHGRMARAALSAGYRAAASRSICDAVLRSHEFMACQSIACYLATAEEVDTFPIIARAWSMQKRVYAPVVARQDHMSFVELTPDTALVQSRFGLWEPQSILRISPQKIDLVITPVVAFDAEKNRVGMGRAYFDRCFAFLKNRRSWLRPKLLGVAFDTQRVRKIKTNPWDIRLYAIVTETSRL